MKINGIHLYNFRNYRESHVVFDNGISIVCGKNASGKTNLLEAVFYFASMKSFRGSKDRELMMFGSDSALIKMEYTDYCQKNTMEVRFEKGEKKIFYRNGCRVTKLSEYLGMFRAVVFTPDHLNLVKGAPEFRRKFIDLAICQSFPRYVASLNDYNKTLVQKNALLKSSFDPVQKKILLDVYNEKLSLYASIITVNRDKYIKALEAEAKKIHAEMEEKEVLTLEYISQIGQALSQEEARVKYRELLFQKQDYELSKYFSVVGPHKDDFKILINGKTAKTYSSQGQQRTAVVSLKLAEGEISKNLTGEYPVFLLDDVLSELDNKRCTNIIEKIKEKQVIITDCEEDIIKLSCNKIFVKDGEITCSYT